MVRPCLQRRPDRQRLHTDCAVAGRRGGLRRRRGEATPPASGRAGEGLRPADPDRQDRRPPRRAGSREGEPGTGSRRTARHDGRQPARRGPSQGAGNDRLAAPQTRRSAGCLAEGSPAQRPDDAIHGGGRAGPRRPKRRFAGSAVEPGVSGRRADAAQRRAGPRRTGRPSGGGCAVEIRRRERARPSGAGGGSPWAFANIAAWRRNRQAARTPREVADGRRRPTGAGRPALVRLAGRMDAHSRGGQIEQLENPPNGR